MKRAVRYTCPRCKATRIVMMTMKVSAVREVCVPCLEQGQPVPGPKIDEHW